MNSIIARLIKVLAGAVLLGIAGSAAAQVGPVTLTWSAPTTGGAATGYRVYYSATSGGYNSTNKSADLPLSPLSHTFTALTPGNYFFVSRAFNASGESTNSNEVQGSVSNLFQVSLDGVSLATNRTFTVEVLNGATVVGTGSSISNAQANVKISNQIVLPATFDVRVKTAGFLRKKSTGRNASSTAAIGPSFGGDQDNDGDVDLADYLRLKANYGIAAGTTDFNLSGTTDLADYIILKRGYGKVNEN